MKEYIFEELGYFTKNEIEAIKKVMDGKTYMQFEVTHSNSVANCILIVRTHEDVTEEELKNIFLASALSEMRYHQLMK